MRMRRKRGKRALIDALAFNARLCEALLLAFILAKALELVDWGWALVLSPLWIPALALVLVLVAGGMACIVLELVAQARLWMRARNTMEDVDE